MPLLRLCWLRDSHDSNVLASFPTKLSARPAAPHEKWDNRLASGSIDLAPLRAIGRLFVRRAANKAGGMKESDFTLWLPEQPSVRLNGDGVAASCVPLGPL